MSKVIQLQSGDDITKVVGYLWECENEEVLFNVAPDSSFLQNAIALKLLMRETNRLGKNVVFIVKDPRDRHAAQRAGFETRAVLPPDIEIASKSPAVASKTEVSIGEAVVNTLEEVSAQKYESMIANEVEFRRQSKSAQLKKIFSDINPHASRDAEISSRLLNDEKEMDGAPLKSDDLGVVWPYEPAVEKIKEIGADALAADDSIKDSLAVDGGEKFLIKEAERVPLETAPLAGRELPAGRIDDKKLSRWQEKFSLKKFVADRRGFEEKKEEESEEFIGNKIFSFKFLSVFVGAGLLMGALALFLILPKVEISIQPKTDTLVSELDVVADKGIMKIDETANKIPAQTLRLEKQATGEFAATGQKDLNEKAKGVITIYNEFSSQAQTLVATTRFVSKDDIVFRLVKTVVVPGVKVENGQTIPGSVDADVLADQAGDQGNIAPGRFTIPGFAGSPKFEKFYGVSARAMTGGAKGKSTVIAQADLDGAKKELWGKLQAELTKDIQDQIPAGLKLLAGAMKQDITQTVSSAALGEKADKFSLTLKGSAAALLFDENDLADLAAFGAASGQNNADKKLAANREISYDSLQADFAKGKLSFKAKISQKLVWAVDTAKIKNLIVGRDAEEIKNIFAQRPEIAKATVSFWPFWVNRAPNDFNKIKVAE